METTKKLVKTILLSLVLLISNVSKSALLKDSTALVINGLIISSSKKANLIEKCKVQLFKGNVLVDSAFVRFNKQYEFKLKRNDWYTIKVTAENMIPLMVSFDTYLGQEKVKYNKFYFETELFCIDDLRFMNKDIVEFPIGHVYFNSSTGYFEASERYTSYHGDILFDESKLNDHVAQNDKE
ncbi:MAG: hypothetical protein ACK50A_10495 [Sphingobacteriaceae bacterium]|jgi:hypothetical protein